jgi:hypothetical protein
MQIAFLILTHKHPEQLLRLINALGSPSHLFFIHVDKACSISPFEKTLARATTDKIQFIAKRENTPWASLGFVKAAINGIAEAANQEADFICILSGQDYPIKSVNYISDFFSRSAEKNFVYHFEIPFAYWGGGGLWKLTNYHLQQVRPAFIRKSVNRCLRYLAPVLPERKFPAYLTKPYGGENWMAFNHEAAEYILWFTQAHPDYLDFHRYSYSPDEMFFQTILLNSNKDEIKSNIVNEKLHYINWKTRNSGSSSPVILREIDFDRLSRSNRLFARKFDITVDENILTRIDEEILRR